MLEKIDYGLHGEIYLHSNPNYVIKRINLPKHKKDVYYITLREIDILYRLKECENIVKIITIETKKEKYIDITLEKYDGDLSDFIERYSYDIRMKHLDKFISDITKGIIELHKRKILHRDMKCRNILYKKNVDNTFKFCLCDFSLSRQLISKTRLSGIYGCEYCFSPEKYSGNYDFPSDVWSFGCILYEYITSKKLLLASDLLLNILDIETYKKIINGNIEHKDLFYNENGILTLNMLHIMKSSSIIIEDKILNIMHKIFTLNPIFRLRCEDIYNEYFKKEYKVTYNNIISEKYVKNINHKNIKDFIKVKKIIKECFSLNLDIYIIFIGIDIFLRYLNTKCEKVTYVDIIYSIFIAHKYYRHESYSDVDFFDTFNIKNINYDKEHHIIKKVNYIIFNDRIISFLNYMKESYTNMKTLLKKMFILYEKDDIYYYSDIILLFK